MGDLLGDVAVKTKFCTCGQARAVYSPWGKLSNSGLIIAGFSV